MATNRVGVREHAAAGVQSMAALKDALHARMKKDEARVDAFLDGIGARTRSFVEKGPARGDAIKARVVGAGKAALDQFGTTAALANHYGDRFRRKEIGAVRVMGGAIRTLPVIAVEAAMAPLAAARHLIAPRG
jgi:hypothetical protein